MLIIVEPWFAAPGHPAQSLVSTARALAHCTDVSYLVPRTPRDARLDALRDEVATLAPLEVYDTPSLWFPLSTLAAIAALRRRCRAGGGPTNAFFLDAHLVALCAAWPLVAGSCRLSRLSTLYLRGPERLFGHRMARRLVLSFLKRPETRLFLRTLELAQAWRTVLPATLAHKVDVLPSLELSDAAAEPPSARTGPLRFIVAGQIRIGKGLERLVPLFLSRPDLGALTVVGAFASDADRAALPMLTDFPGLREGFIAEQTLLQTVGDHDYVLILYEDWDSRMEAATLFLAARVGRPVVCFDAGWCGRMVRTFGCGVAIASHAGADPTDALAALPRRGTPEYQALVDGCARFREAHAPERLRPVFLEKLTG